MSDSVLVHYEVKDKIALLTLDDPPANTYTHSERARPKELKSVGAHTTVPRGLPDHPVHGPFSCQGLWSVRGLFLERNQGDAATGLATSGTAPQHHTGGGTLMANHSTKITLKIRTSSLAWLSIGLALLGIAVTILVGYLL